MTSGSMEISELNVINHNSDGGGFFFNFDEPSSTHKSATKVVAPNNISTETTSYTYLESFPWQCIHSMCDSQLRKWYSLYPNKETEVLPEEHVIDQENWNTHQSPRVHKSKFVKSKMETQTNKKRRKDKEAIQTKPMELLLEPSSSSSTSTSSSLYSGEHSVEGHECIKQEHSAYVICYQSPPSTSLLTLNNTEHANTSATTSNGVYTRHDERDIIPGKYYGGLKVWSCAPMLARYLVAHELEWRAKWGSNGNNMEHEHTNSNAHPFDNTNSDSTLCDNNNNNNNNNCAEKNNYRKGEGNQCIVMEVGCGQGLCGLAALCLGAQRVIFQDYNEEVLTSCVQPNIEATLIRNSLNKLSVELNQNLHSQEWCEKREELTQEENRKTKQDDCHLSVNSPAYTRWEGKDDKINIGTSHIQIKLVHGDWANLSAHSCKSINQNNSNNNSKLSQETEHEITESNMCDVVLGSDVTFDEEACAKLSALLCRVLKPKTGVALIASKEYYFGTNGGVWEFTQQATAHGLYVTEVHRETEAQTSGMQQVIMQVTRW